MKYIDVQWLHSSPEEPVRLISELGPDRYEARKIELWLDGRVGYASETDASENTRLGEAPVPDISEINADEEFVAKEIDAASFEELWTRYVVGFDGLTDPRGN